MKIALFGGSFNPPHICHVLVAVWAKAMRAVDEVWFVPAYQHAFSKRLIDFEHRCRMIELATTALGAWARLSRVEAEIGSESRTIDTVRHLIRTNPGVQIGLLVGADILLELPRWKEHDRLLELVDLYVVGRVGFSVPDRALALELPEVSSRELRRRLAAGDLDYCRERIPQPVMRYIVDNALYDLPPAAAAPPEDRS